MIECPSRDELLLLLDGEVTENRAAALRAHLASCPACADEWHAQQRLAVHLAAPVPDVPSAGAVELVMRRIAEQRAPVRARRPWRRIFPGAALALFAAAAAMVLVLLRPPAPGFVPRGGAVSWERKVGVELWEVEQPPRRLVEGMTVKGATAYVARYRNLTNSPAYLLAFALDSGGEVHWLYPGYVDAKSDPAALSLPPSSDAQVLPDSVVLEDVSQGSLRLFTVISPTPLSVSQVERLRPSELEPSGLRERFRGSRVDMLRVDVALPGRTP